ncbi:MAG TPA: AMP-binding protein [Dehalococcoidia bacterium]|nr:AMP-binding protein [Dehalococcoidia bacterium]
MVETPRANMTDYEQTRREFRLDVPECFNFAEDVLDTWAQDPDKLGMLWVNDAGEERRITFRQFSDRSKRFANVLQGLGVGRGDIVFVMLHRIPEWWEIFMGVLRHGSVMSPGTMMLTPKDLQYRFDLSQAKVAITDADSLGKIQEIRDQCPSLQHVICVGGSGPGVVDYEEAMGRAPDQFASAGTRSDDPALMFFTSGTTGYPKMVLHTQASYGRGHEITGRFWLDLRPDDLHWTLSDTGWAKAAWSCVFAPWIMGAAIFMFDARGRFGAVETLQALSKYPITTFCGPPTAYRMMVLEDLSKYRLSLRHCVGAGEPLNPEVIEAWQAGTGLTIRDGYGQTETVLLCGNFPPLEVRPGSMGKPSPGFEIAVIDENGRPVAPNQEGDIAVRVSPNRPVGLFKEYWKDPEITQRALRSDWYITGDRAYVDEDGYFWFVGRADDVIISAGYRIGPFEVESAVIEHEAVAEAAVVASPDEMRGEIVKAFVILAPGHQASDELATAIQDHVKRVTAPYKYPREIEFVTELPKTISGKIRRIELRQREWAKKGRRRR